jgi:FkbM family methyltransferase
MSGFVDFKSKSEQYFNKEVVGVIHVGAHHGQEYWQYVEMGIPNMLFFEPVKSNFEVLKTRVPNELIVNCAVGDMNGHIDMFIETANNGQSSSILEPNLHLKLYPYITFNSKETVEIVRLDDYVKDKTKFNALNIDTQGYEFEVFKGAKELLHNIDIINVEVNADQVYSGCAHYTEIDSYLAQYGFKRVLVEWAGGGTWGDAFYVK